MPKCIYDLETQEYKCNINNEVYVFKDKEEMIFNLIQYKKKKQIKSFKCSACGKRFIYPFPTFSYKKSMFGINYVNDVCSSSCFDKKYLNK